MGRREEKTERTKALLMENALLLFKEKGYDAVTVEEITRASGVAKGTFYSYFSVKSDIIVEEFWKIDAYYEEYAAHHLQEYETPEDKLRAFTKAQMGYVRDQVGNDSLKILYVNQTLQLGKDKVILDTRRRWYQIVGSVIEEGQKTGHFRDDQNPEELTRIFNRSMRSVFLDWCITDGAFDLVDEGLSYLDNWLLPALRSEIER